MWKLTIDLQVIGVVNWHIIKPRSAKMAVDTRYDHFAVQQKLEDLEKFRQMYRSSEHWAIQPLAQKSTL